MRRIGLRLHADEEHWIPLADLMTGLMFLFLLISLVYMVQVDAQKARPESIVARYSQIKSQLYRDLYGEFHADLPVWGATIDSRTLSIRFYARNVLFAPGSIELRPRFKTILANFFPRYVRILHEPKYRDIVSELRIEGYTSSFWRSGASTTESYIGNMALSQSRTRSVLSYVLGLPAVSPQQAWLMQVLTANGLSSSHLVRRKDGSEDPNASQRVEFRVRTNSDEQIQRLLALPASEPLRIVIEPSPPVLADSIPAYPIWASRLLGARLSVAFSKRSFQCLGYLDGVVARYAGTRQGIKVFGWSYDAASKSPIAKVVFTDDSGRIVGAGAGGFQRPDVPARLPAIASTLTGWQGYVEPARWPVTAWGIMSRPDTVCRLQPARPLGDESM